MVFRLGATSHNDILVQPRMELRNTHTSRAVSN